MSPTTHKSHVAQQLLDDIRELPSWVKQVIYLELQQELNQHFSPESMEGLTPEDTIAFFVPKITPSGEQSLLETRNEVNSLLLDVHQNYTVLDICLRRSWSLEMCCTYIMEAIGQNWLEPPVSVKAMGTVEYMANRIRLGEYLVKMGRLTPEQLDQALRTQQYIKESLQEHTGLANILINLGYINRQDTEGILFLKEESRKPVENMALLQKFAEA